ncbi:hypothetical protein QBC33DRAFT_488865 [Phialemonium atrogriseum]|uniref:VLRF1 domain-containing protein n=1 Tax=Phialemonium atrogriseum TaxID=1093897 RepID=A0AAJ0FMY3_9PEZI|nr:uncharacterized protein QBC33DRAFT_488865 [Phialemonium atrogriseum]KAK1768733.1 hypothetical protein QBC33DRAFT_488865 [Phialemonium atrogriseum]
MPLDMEKKEDELLRRPLYLYDLPQEVLDTLSLKTDAEGQEQQVIEQGIGRPSDESPDLTTESVAGSQACSLCGVVFPTIQEQKSHLKSDYHHYNLKQKIRGHKPVSEAEFEKLIENLDESLSGSDSSDTEDEDDEPSKKDTTLTALLKKQATLAERKQGNEVDEEDGARKKKPTPGKHPLLWFGSPVLPENTYFGLYRAMFSKEELEKQEDILEAIKRRQLPPIAMPKPSKNGAPAPSSYKGPHIFLCMIGGGHFAAMVVSLAPRQTKSAGPLNREATVLAHKTFHRYTTRRKQGGSQSANDNAKGAAHSAGSSIRRYNEQALIQDVRELLQDWKGLLDTSDLLFIRATGSTNRRTLFGPYEGQVLRANDPRIRSFPFNSRRATQNELMRSFIELTRLKVQEINPVATPDASKTPGASAPAKPAKPAAPKLSEEEETALLHTSQLQALIRRSKLPALLSYLSTNSLDPNFRFHPPDSQQNHHAPTPLHLAAAHNSAALVSGLLVRGGADPTAASAEGRTAFELAGDRATRDAFRVARSELGEGGWDWEGARVPAPLRREEAEGRAGRERAEREAAEAERRRAEEERLRAQGGPTGGKVRPGRALAAGLQKTAQEAREEEARGMTPEQRVRLERERRARAAEERMRRLQAGG